MGIGSTKEFLLHCTTEEIDPASLAEKSRSFRFFHNDLLTWEED